MAFILKLVMRLYTNYFLFYTLLILFLSFPGGLEAKVFLGVESADISKEKARLLGFTNHYGVYVQKVIPGTAAEFAGVQPFDYIYGIDEFRVNESQGLGYILSKFYVGDVAQLYLVRKGKNLKLRVKFIQDGKVSTFEKDKCNAPYLGIKQNLSTPVINGILVSVVDNSTAEIIGLQDKDIILKINGFQMVDWQDIKIAINAMDVGETIRVEFLRKNRLSSTQGPIKGYCSTLLLKNNSNQFPQQLPKQIPPDFSIHTHTPNLVELEKINKQTDLALPLTNSLTFDYLNIDAQAEKGLFTLEFGLRRSNPIVIRIYNNVGRLVYSYELKTFDGAFKDEVDIATNGGGNYFMEIKQGTQSAVRKLSLS